MPEESLEILRRAVEAFNERDLATLDDLTSPDFEFSPYLATLIESTTYRGHEGLRKYFEDAESAWQEIDVRLEDLREVGDGHIYSSGELYGRGRASGLEVRIPLAWVSEVRNGKLTRVQSYQSADDARKAAGIER